MAGKLGSLALLEDGLGSGSSEKDFVGKRQGIKSERKKEKVNGFKVGI